MSPRAAIGEKTLPLLLIEDEGSVLNFLRMALERNGYACAAAHSAAEGIRLLEAGQFGGIISDMRTPGGISGADVHAWIVKNRPQLKDRMLFITGDTVNDDTMKVLVRTGVPYIEKPFRVTELMVTVEKIFGKAK
ncbi:MAG TPA: response regulator [Candidatus Angelobacter sp.]|jgi:DNA-binding NtrC family response regulator|nr:response regulator [Candidatus Angelobacter sp.]